MNENFYDAPHHPDRRSAAGASGPTIPEFEVPPAPTAVTAPPRRGNRTGPGYEVPREYVEEFFAMPSTIPAAGIPMDEETVDFDRLIAEESPVDFERLLADEAPADFEKLAAREADDAFRSAILPPGTPTGNGGLTDFAVYGEPEVIRPEATFPPHLKAPANPVPVARAAPAAAGAGGLGDFAIYGDPDSTPRELPAVPPTPVDPSRDVGVTEKPNFYVDPSGDDVTHNIRLAPGKTLSLGNRRVFRADSRGIPIFSPGWTAGMAAAHYRRGFIVRASLAVVFIGLSAVLAFLAIGADSNYLSVKENGVAVVGTVSGVATDVKKDEKATSTELGATVTETASVQFQVNGKTYKRNISDTSKSAAAMIGTDLSWKAGQKVRMYADLDHSGQVLVEDTSQPGRFNFLSLSPLILAAMLGMSAGFSWQSVTKMRKIAAAEE